MMKKLFSLRSLSTLAILWIAVSALILGIKVSVSEVQEASFFAVAAFAATLAYLLGLGSWPARRALPLILVAGFMLAFLESAGLAGPVRTLLQSIPQFELSVLRWLAGNEPPDFGGLQIQFMGLKATAGAFLSQVLTFSVDDPRVREFLWDMPLLLLGAWAGWRIGRHDQILSALAPALSFHAFLLNYTGRETFSLQIAVFAMILLIGINQKWSGPRERTENSERAARETYSAVILLSIGVAILAGLAPSISIHEVAKKLSRKDEIAKTIGLEKEMVAAYAISGLPRQHLIGLSPALSRTVIFKVRTGELPPTENSILGAAVPRHYWRWLTYDVYNGQGWATSPVESQSYSAAEPLFSIPNTGYQIIHQQVEKALPDDTRLYWTGSLVSVSQPFNASWRSQPESLVSSPDPTFGADMLGAVSDAQSYQADSIVPLVSAEELRSSSSEYPQEVTAKYLSLPETLPQRVRDLAQSLTAGIENPYDRARAIEAYLREYPYTLDVPPPPPDRDVADYFLFDLKKGYCDYYATSMVVLARSAGLPARLVIGYANGVYDPNRAEYVVHEAEAHSWVEIYFTGYGWIEFEPTASELEITLPDQLPQETAPGLPAPDESFQAKNGFFPRWNPLPTAFGLAAATAAASVFWFFRTQGLWRVHKTIGSLYAYVYYHGRKIYKDAPLYETPLLFAGNLSLRIKAQRAGPVPAVEEIRLLTDLYIQETYSAHPVTTDERSKAVKAWKRLFWRLLYARLTLRP